MTEANPSELRAALQQLFQPFRDTATHTARLVKQVGVRLDAMSLDLARDGGVLVRNAQAFADAARDQATSLVRATPRVTRLAQIAAVMFARQRWLRLANTARGGEGLSDDDHRELARRTTAYTAELRGGIAKLGQIASCRPDLVGAIWAGELAVLQDDVPPIAAAEIRARIAAELGRELDEVFSEFDDVPVAAASLAQVHAAVLRDGTRVVVKVQVPGIEHVIAADVAALETIASAIGELPGVDLAMVTAELTRALATELDYEAEADALARYAGTVLIPRPIREASSARVLTMTRIDGERLTAWLDNATAEHRDRLFAELVEEVAAQILVRGQVHADPHSGNFLVVSGKLALLDFGCMLELSAAERAAYARLVLAIAGANLTGAATELETLGFRAGDRAQLVEVTASLIGALRPGAQVVEIDWQAAFADQIARAKQLGGLEVPRSFVLLGRVLAVIGGMLAAYRPRIALHPLIARHLLAAIA